MVEVREAIVVEGRYDKNTLSQVIKAPIFETSGFGESIRRSACNIVPCYDDCRYGYDWRCQQGL